MRQLIRPFFFSPGPLDPPRQVHYSNPFMSSFIGTLPHYAEAFLRLFFPSVCVSCSQLLGLNERGLCGPCKRNVQKCKLAASEERIRVSSSSAAEGWTLFRYEDSVKDLFHHIKFQKRRDLIRLFDEDLSDFLDRRRTELSSYDLLIPIPLDHRRRVEREYNQSALLAEKIAQILKVKFEPGRLVKKRSTSSQSLLGREARRMNLSGVFKVSRPDGLPGRTVLLVDDIFTTGATLEEAKRTLKAAGVSRVGCLTLARTFHRSS